MLMRTTAETTSPRTICGRGRTHCESSGDFNILLLSSIFIPRTCFIVGVRVDSMLFLLCYVFQMKNSTVAGARYDVLASARLLDAFVPYRRIATISTSINKFGLRASLFSRNPYRFFLNSKPRRRISDLSTLGRDGEHSRKSAFRADGLYRYPRHFQTECIK